jgi:RNA polymerase sigma factor (sigma-70 family)
LPACDVPDETALALRAATGGDVMLFGEIVRRLQGRVRAFCLRLTKGDHALADDIAQETFLAAHRKIGQYRGDGSFAGWLYRIAWTRFRMHARNSRQTEELDDDMAGANADPHAKLDLERAMARLAAPERAALTLCYALEFSHGEAAAILELPLGTLKSHVQRGREKLRALLSEEVAS